MVKFKITVRKITSRKELWAAFSIRLKVFVREQNVPREIELDEDDRCATHLLAFWSADPVGTARVVIRKGRAKIGRMAVLKRFRGKAFGQKLLIHAVALAKRRKAKIIYLHAQLPVVGFYKKMGFRPVGKVFMEAGIPHRKMVYLRVSDF